MKSRIIVASISCLALATFGLGTANPASAVELCGGLVPTIYWGPGAVATAPGPQ